MDFCCVFFNLFKRERVIEHCECVIVMSWLGYWKKDGRGGSRRKSVCDPVYLEVARCFFLLRAELFKTSHVANFYSGR